MKMDFELLKKLGAADIAILAVFIVYIVFPVSTPQVLVPIIDSPIGMAVMFAVAVGLFVYRSPILGVLFVFVAYELLRRNHYEPPASPIQTKTQYLANRVPQALPTQSQKNSDLQLMNPAKPATLEEEIVAKDTPLGRSQLPVFTNTSFQPVADRSQLGMTQV